ncbi:consortin, connexin sorting protein [Phyllostomus discolor]|uniref:Consortin, connexin sorting protein n=1 Tax=Phyllostomus discolor TaxID=89673 RepID=A0A834DAA9_9CHIR|nr:consortin, connexin sorting protein [Phyllostomus discolor]
MDDCETPAYNLQVEPQDGCRPGDSVESAVTRLPSASDENENQLGRGGHECLTGSDSTMGRPEVTEQDSLNNNDSCTPSCEVAARESSENTPRGGPGDGQDWPEKDKKIPAKRSSRSKGGTAKKIIPPGLASGDATSFTQENVLCAVTRALGDAESAAGHASDPPEAPKLALRPLFSLLRGEAEQLDSEQLDSRALPLCLHQMAESYFQEEDYEKAMKFIQLERLYHEQLLANLSAIQEQWETKWRTAQPHTLTSARNSDKGFNGDDLERLTQLCTTHQDPLSSKHKIAATEKSLGRKCITQLIASEDPEECGAAAREPESETRPGMDPSAESQPEGGAPESSPCGSHRARPADPLGLPVTAGRDHTAEQPEHPLGCAEGATGELHAQSQETAGGCCRPHSSENVCEGDRSLPPQAQTDACQDVAETEGPAEDPQVVLPGESGTEPLILPGSNHTPPPALCPEGKHSQTQRKELHLPLRDAASEAWPSDRPEHNELNEPQPPDRRGRDGKSPQGPASSEGSDRVPCGNASGSDLSAGPPEACMAPEGPGEQGDQVSKETEDYLNSLLEGCLKDADDSLPYEEEDSDPLQDLSPEEASYSLQEPLPAEEGCLSLDDLAKRIEIAEVAPAEGLVSILKKRGDAAGDHPAQMQQKPSKRRVRFQEIDDHLDQDEVGGGSCILLVLLCIATVLLSVGGTALYCAFGDMESPVCTDFADNVDFYYTKLLQGVAGLKHWVYLS